MDIKVNGKDESFDGDQLTVTELLKASNVEQPEMVSVQINGEFIERENFDTKTVASGDEVDFLYFMGGGRV